MSEATTYTCPRHKVETPLTCVTCETPICPDCYVRTAVGLRCPKCGEGVTVKVGGRPRWVYAAAGVAALALVAVLVAVLAGGGGDDKGNDADAVGVPPAGEGTGEGGAAPGYRLVNRGDLGYSVEVPMQWQQAADNTDTVTSYAEPRSTEGSLRVTVGQADVALADQVNRLVDRLTTEGGREFVKTDVQLGAVPAVRLAYLFPTSSTPGSSLATHTSYLAVNKGKTFSFQLSTTDPSGKDSVFRYMASKFILL